MSQETTLVALRAIGPATPKQLSEATGSSLNAINRDLQNLCNKWGQAEVI